MTSILNMTKEEQRTYKKKFKSSIEDLDQAQLDVIEAIGETFTPLMKNQGVSVSKSLATRALEAQARILGQTSTNGIDKSVKGADVTSKPATFDSKEPSALELKYAQLVVELKKSRAITKANLRKTLVKRALIEQAKLRG